MPRFNVNAPDGSIIPVDAPAGATEQDAIAFAAATWKPSSGIPAARQSAVDQIPGVNPNMTQPAPAKPLTLKDKIMGAIETPFAVGANVITAPITYLAGAGGPEFQRNVANEITYQPRTQLAQEAVETVGRAAEASKIPPYMTPVKGLSGSMAPALQAAGDVAQVGKAIATAPIARRNARIAQERSLQSYQDAGRIDAATQGSQIGLVANPAEMNPTTGNRIKSFVTDPKTINEAAAKANDKQVPKIALKEMGLSPNTALNSDAPFMAAREAASGPYKEIAKLPSMTASPEIISSIEALRPSKILLGEERAAKLNDTINTSLQELSNGLTGAETVKSISDLRAQAQNLNNAQKAGHPIPASDVDKINVYRGVADALEQMVEDNVRDPKLLNDLRNARVKIAKIHAYEDATDFNTGKIDPAELAKLTAKNPRLTGDIATIGRFAGNFPEAMGLTTPETIAQVAGRKLTRTSLSGATGAAIGTAVGAPLAGLAVGAAAGELGSSLMANRMVGSKYQAAKAIPTDYRAPVVNNLQPGTSNLAIFDPVNALANPPPPMSKPNWVYAQPQPEVRTGVQPMPPQLEAPSGASTMRTVAEQRQFDYNMQKALEEQAAQAQAAREAAGRQVTKGGVVIGEQPVQGQGLPQPASLSEASRKVAAGQMFDMTAPEKVMWDRTRVTLEQVAPDLKKLTDKQIANKAMDREWIADTVSKARDKAAAFDELAQRMVSEQVRRDAAIKREQLLDLAAMLEDNLSAPRPTSTGGQGPKTREAIRNRLLGGDNQNNLR